MSGFVTFCSFLHHLLKMSFSLGLTGSPGHTWITQKSNLFSQCAALSQCVPMQSPLVLVLILINTAVVVF